MATYEYKCRNCDNHFEVQQSMKEDSLKHCDKCGEDELYRVIGQSAPVLFRGSGKWMTGGSGY